MTPTWRILEGDCVARLRELDAGSVHTCVTSPPYFGLRDYGTGAWDGGDATCDHQTTRQARSDRPRSGLTGGLDHVAAQDLGATALRECPCGARRVDKQIGLEPSPDEFVAALVGVFREVRRVLRDDGTVWLNLGDSYAGGGGGNYGDGKNVVSQGGQQVTNVRNRPDWLGNAGVKAKDLLGIPWMVAFALRQPYYDGDIKRERERVWLAAMIDAEGSIGVNWQRAGEHRARDSYSLSIKVSNTNRRIVERCAEIAGCGSDLLHDRRGRDCFAWSVYGDDARRVLREVYPYLVAKQQEARLAYGELSHPTYEAMRLLHAGTETTVDGVAPPDCWTPGWYLRSDIIWAKPNPMPESVTDRPTKAHEYVFLLSKRARYFYDADAIREPHIKPFDNSNRSSYSPGYSGNGRIRDGAKSDDGLPLNEAGRNKRSVWTVATQPYAGAHFATFPPKLIEPCILAGCPEGGTVLDPFAGSGTTGMVALRHGRSFVGIELNPAYAALARDRITADAPLLNSFAEVAV